MKQTNETIGLREQIVAAKSTVEVQALLTQGRYFYQASDKTRRAWAATAKRKLVTFKR
jgi:hypothetical protein